MSTPADIKIVRGSSNNSIAGGAFPTAQSDLTGAIHELFFAVSPAQAQAGFTDYRLIAVYNANITEPLDSLKIYTSAQTSSPDTEISLGVVTGLFYMLGSTNTNPPGLTYPSIASVTTPPADVTFYPASSFAEALSLGTLPANRWGRFIWVKRVVNAGATATASDSCTITVTNRV